MRPHSFLLLILLLSGHQLLGQFEPIKLTNPSFEGTPSAASLPYGWLDCGFAEETVPDTHPHMVDGSYSFGVTTRPQHGKTYVGMVVRDNDSWEAIGQRLSTPLVAGKCYEFTIHIARSSTYLSSSRTSQDLQNYARPSVLKIWGGDGFCGKKELLAESTIINNTRWLEFNFKFTPEEEMPFILFEAFYLTPVFLPYNGNILIDNASAIIPVPCDDEVPEIIAIEEPEETKEEEPKIVISESTTKQLEKSKPTKTPNKEIKINEDLKESNIVVGKTIELKNIYFKADSSAFNAFSYPALEELYSFLKENDRVKVEIGGHTNNIPSNSFCDRLSSGRAKSVYSYLVEKGISKERLTYKGYGKRRPIASNDTPEGRQKNQRVEIRIISIKT